MNGARFDAEGGIPRISAPHLTPTQVKVMQGVQSGLLNKQIAFDLGIAEATVKAHMTALMRKLKVRNRTQVALAAEDLGWSARQPRAAGAALSKLRAKA
jgi:DNA-binding NarL/FixJ family response regulator